MFLPGALAIMSGKKIIFFIIPPPPFSTSVLMWHFDIINLILIILLKGAPGRMGLPGKRGTPGGEVS